jgi:hypothetical protein
MTIVLLWVPLAIVALVATHAIIDKLTAASRGVDGIALFVRRVDLRLLEDLLDPQVEAGLRTSLSSFAFRRLQRQRILAAREQIDRISHNATILLEWGTREYSKIASKGRGQFDSRDLLIIAVVESACQVKRGAWWAMLKLRFWRAILVQVWPFLPSPSLSDLREVYGRDLLQAYEGLTSSAGELLLAFGGEQYDEVRAAL